MSAAMSLLVQLAKAVTLDYCLIRLRASNVITLEILKTPLTTAARQSALPTAKRAFRKLSAPNARALSSSQLIKPVPHASLTAMSVQMIQRVQRVQEVSFY